MSSLSGLQIAIPLALLPSIGWIVVYRYLDSREPEPFSTSALAFIFGALCTIPVFFIQFIFSSYPDFNLVSLLSRGISSPLLLNVFFLIFVGLIEELVKASALVLLVKRREKDFNQLVDGIVYGAIVGAGFGLSENIYYFYKALDAFQLSSSFLAVFLIRSFGTLLAHTLFTGIFGFFYAKAYFSPFIDENSRHEKIWHNLKSNLRKAIRLHTTFFHLLPGWYQEPPSFSRNAVILEGYILAVLLHFLYNALIKIDLFGTSWTALIIPLIFLLAWYLWSRFFIRVYTRILDFVRVKRDVYRLRVH